MAIATVKPDAHQPAPADDETFEAVVPEDFGEEAEGVEDANEAEGAEDEPEQPAPAVKAATEKPAAKATRERPAAKPAAEAETEGKKDEGLSPAAREERAKRKLYAKRWEATAADLDRALAELDSLRRRPGMAKASPEHVATLRKRADEAPGMADLMQITLDEMDRRDESHSRQLEEALFNLRCAVSEVNARVRHKDYDDALLRSGIYQGLQVASNGAFVNPALAKRVYTAQDPGEAAYQLAVGKLEYEAQVSGMTEEDEPAERPAERSAAKPAGKPADKPAERPAEPPPPAEPTGEALERARREGAREVAERVVDNSQRPRGIRHVRPAGSPVQRLSKQQLDEMADIDPVGFRKLCAKNPELEAWWLGK